MGLWAKIISHENILKFSKSGHFSKKMGIFKKDPLFTRAIRGGALGWARWCWAPYLNPPLVSIEKIVTKIVSCKYFMNSKN